MLTLNEKIDFNKLSTDNNQKKEQLDKEQLIDRVHYLFSIKDLYTKTKEKTIMITIKYNPNFEDLYDTIVEKYCRNKQLQKRLLKYKSTILNIFKQKNIQIFVHLFLVSYLLRNYILYYLQYLIHLKNILIKKFIIV